jgi:hypothetical protein
MWSSSERASLAALAGFDTRQLLEGWDWSKVLVLERPPRRLGVVHQRILCTTTGCDEVVRTSGSERQPRKIPKAKDCAAIYDGVVDGALLIGTVNPLFED